MTAAEFRAFALSLPETSQGEHSGLATFLVRGRRFATLDWPGPGQVAFALSPDELEMLLGACPAMARASGAWGARGHGHLDLAAADEATARSITAMAWRRSAPPALARRTP
ncbi:MAG TPA: MmcQ/YjbR family DNA-binding protein [Caulobacteraceae bacterium]|jgi:hypothetical protein|nr:MmcQ/YjbR family DNA-binding protein [Caulobacteraceae bacterium]